MSTGTAQRCMSAWLYITLSAWLEEDGAVFARD